MTKKQLIIFYTCSLVVIVIASVIFYNLGVSSVKVPETIQNEIQESNDVQQENSVKDVISDNKLSAYQMVGFTKREIEEQFGTSYETTYFLGSAAISYEKPNMLFCFPGEDESNLHENVMADVVVTGEKKQEIYDGVKIGDSLSDLEKALSLQATEYVDEEYGEIKFFMESSSHKFYVYTDNNKVDGKIVAVELWKK